MRSALLQLLWADPGRDADRVKHSLPVSSREGKMPRYFDNATKKQVKLNTFLILSNNWKNETKNQTAILLSSPADQVQYLKEQGIGAFGHRKRDTVISTWTAFSRCNSNFCNIWLFE
jgi:hypothetical protein